MKDVKLRIDDAGSRRKERVKPNLAKKLRGRLPSINVLRKKTAKVRYALDLLSLFLSPISIQNTSVVVQYFVMRKVMFENFLLSFHRQPQYPHFTTIFNIFSIYNREESSHAPLLPFPSVDASLPPSLHPSSSSPPSSPRPVGASQHCMWQGTLQGHCRS